MVAGHAVLETMGATRIEGEVPTDSTDLLARWVGCVVETVGCDGFRNIEIDDAGLDDYDAFFGIELDDPIEAVQSDDDPVFDGQRAAA
jgi:hypothetical protein